MVHVRRCGDCGGLGKVREDGEVVACEACAGFGDYLLCRNCWEAMRADSQDDICNPCMDELEFADAMAERGLN